MLKLYWLIKDPYVPPEVYEIKKALSPATPEEGTRESTWVPYLLPEMTAFSERRSASWGKRRGLRFQ
jgi:hypothetical protein